MLRILLRTVMTSMLLLPIACDDRPATPRDRADRSGTPKFDDGPSLASQAPEVAPTTTPATADPATAPAEAAPDPSNAAAPAAGVDAPPLSTAPATAPQMQPDTQPLAPRTGDDPISDMDQARGNSISEMDQPRSNSISEMQGDDRITHEPQRQQ